MSKVVDGTEIPIERKHALVRPADLLVGAPAGESVLGVGLVAFALLSADLLGFVDRIVGIFAVKFVFNAFSFKLTHI